MRLAKRRGRVPHLLAAIAVILAGLLGAPAAWASHNQVTVVQDDPNLYANPAWTLSMIRELGATVVRVTVTWANIAPAPNSWHIPRHFDGANPADYPAANWRPLDRIIQQAAADGITVDLNPASPVPLWATGPGMPKASAASGYPFHNWRPSAVQFGKFVKALGTRYSGTYDPELKRTKPGAAADLPRVGFWSVWNEPDFGPHLAPQGLPGHRGVQASPAAYRALVDHAWAGLHQSGHGADTIVIGELAPRSEATAPDAFGNFNGMTPLVFLRTLYCLDDSYHPLRGAAALIRGCPATAAGTARFVSQHPGLFQATAYSDHPYMYGFPPDRELNSPPLPYFASEVGQYSTLATIGNLERGLGRIVAAYHQHEVFPIWNTEYGIITNPPHRTFINGARGMSWTQAALYDNWAEYLSWKNPRLVSFAQYEIQDSQPTSDDWGGFATGLITFAGRPKNGLDAFRLPLYLPNTTASSASKPLEVWGDVRPLHFALLDAPYAAETATLQFRPVGQHDWQPLAQVNPTSSGYFDQRVAFPVSGQLRLEWTYPSATLGPTAGQTVHSRSVQVTVK